MLYTFQDPDGGTHIVGDDEVDHYAGLGWQQVASGAELYDILPIEELIDAAWQKLKAKREQVRYGGCITPKGVMQNDPESQAKLTSAVVLSNMIPNFLVGWKMSDNTIVDHDGAELAAAGVAMGLFDQQVFGFAEATRLTLANMTRAELGAFDVDALAWPT